MVAGTDVKRHATRRPWMARHRRRESTDVGARDCCSSDNGDADFRGDLGDLAVDRVDQHFDYLTPVMSVGKSGLPRRDVGL
jgi:hypothetical protein